jgi:ABC-type nitrate/sulfonate/bicarbonate transport system permease component
MRSPRRQAAERGSVWGRRWAPAAVGLGTLVAIVALLQVATTRGWINAFLVPPPSEIVASYPMLVTEERLLPRFLATAAEGFVAAAIATVLGGLIGWSFYRWRTVQLAYRSWFVGLNASPSLLLYPLFLVIFGRNTVTIVALGVLSALPPIVLKTAEGLITTRKVLLDVGRAFDLTPLQQFRLVHLPAAAPVIFSGVRIGLIYAVITVVGIEYLIAYGGLGELVPDLADRYEIPAMYAAIIFIILVSAAVQFVVVKVERWLRPI